MRTDLAVWVVLLIIVTAVRWSTTSSSALIPLISQQQQHRQFPGQRQPQSPANCAIVTALPSTCSQRCMVRLQSSVDVPSDDDGGTTSTTSVRYRCRVAYDGSGFSGFQLQRQGGRGEYGSGGGGGDDENDGTSTISKRTVQGVMEQVLHQRFGRIIRVVGAGRTDTGVHARGQAVHFDLSTIEHDKICNNNLEQPLETAMNKMLPPDIRVWNVGMAPAPCEEIVKNHGPNKVYAWNVMRKSSSKLYSYRICLADAMDPLRRHDRWQIDSNWFQSGNTKMDLEYLAQLLRCYEGTHDFVCFAGALEANARKTGVKMTTVRTVHRCELICEDEHYKLYRIDIYLDGALYKMVRNLVGTAIDVWRQAFPEDSFGRLLDEPSQHGLTRDDNPCKPAPPHGLTLERVFYAGDDDF